MRGANTRPSARAPYTDANYRTSMDSAASAQHKDACVMYYEVGLTRSLISRGLYGRGYVSCLQHPNENPSFVPNRVYQEAPELRLARGAGRERRGADREAGSGWSSRGATRPVCACCRPRPRTCPGWTLELACGPHVAHWRTATASRRPSAPPVTARAARRRPALAHVQHAAAYARLLGAVRRRVRAHL